MPVSLSSPPCPEAAGRGRCFIKAYPGGKIHKVKEAQGYQMPYKWALSQTKDNHALLDVMKKYCIVKLPYHTIHKAKLKS